ncbi:increased loss of mitochondrial DNA protein 1 [Paecilomyces variotii]|uniref:Increased loss of mitochondrial DNA protein 1 n=1 Tax=Byssochlamys spectabilis TaxID=264951 RepID=A0A443I2N4_BYSSP|nr:increased loss of mitochondrial DNA protein 1 [Paecilomyces variotii]KAJ9222609.1 hypothetical protein DTO169C6_5033 [Paecilomyces variotii]KAJ9248207.1 hypothetical protein DTO207G8_7509 [Paecilomyces variotii]KAJ9267336.1 hypothetical protein DTO195F2_569 [Paecilomyces variotii]KAJ9284471.1 hypothetical protein DTO021C3_7908 [Paecilomyces variotii]KAJ9303481.1 hypothetical protein DTO217A2_7071 [Paecilomyces variotii]
MGFFSSKTLIQAHALFLFVLAVYLTKSPEAITDSDLVLLLGEAMKIDVSPTFARPQSPFALCGILLVADALVDLIVVTKVPQINEVLARADVARSRSNGSTAVIGNNPFAIRMAALYSEIWTLLAASRFCLFFAVSIFIYQSKPVAWGVSADESETMTGLGQLKNRVVFTYGFMEMMFWLWILLTLREERQETAARLAAAEAEHLQ